MARVKGTPTAGSGSLQTKTPELPFGLRCFHSNSRMKFSYCFWVRSTPVGTPVVTIIPSRAVKVSGALLTATHPVRFLPLNSGTKPSSSPAVSTVSGRKRQGRRSHRLPVMALILVRMRRRFRKSYDAGRKDPPEPEVPFGFSSAVGFGIFRAGEPTMARKPSKDEADGIRVVCRNRRAFHDYTVQEVLECGLVLTGTEVKSLRERSASLEDAYAKVEG